MLQDKSVDYTETWEFLARRMEEGNQLQSVLALSDEKTKNMTKALNSAFLTVSFVKKKKKDNFMF